MPNITIQGSGQCSGGYGTITGNWTSVNVQDAVVTAYGTATSASFTQVFTNVSGGSFTFPSLPNDLYEVSAEGTADGYSNLLEINISCSVPPPPGCDLELIGMTLTPKTGTTDNGSATIEVYGTGAMQYSLDNSEWKSSNVFTGLAAGIYTVYVRKADNYACSIQEGFVINEVQEFTVVSAPARDWLPVELPILYKFTVPMLTPEPATVRVEVSNNGVDFDNPVLAGIMNVLPDSSNQYTLNPAPYLAAMFRPAPPILGTDPNLFKLFRLSIGRASLYDGTAAGTPELITVPARCLYASVYTTAESNGDIILSQSPADGYNADFAGILTKVNNLLQVVTNTATDAPASPALPCTKHPVQLYWLNRSGGWQSWVFDGKHEYEDEVSEGVTWKDASDHLHTASLGPVLQRVNVYSGFVSKADFETIHGVRHSIRVYHKDGSQWREVNIDRGSFPKYKAGDKRREVNFSFVYSEPLQVQHA